MAKVLIVYGTTEGQTRKIAAQVAETACDLGHAARAVDGATTRADPAGYDAVIVAGSLHGGRHQRPLARFVRANLPTLARVPTAFLSVSLSAAGSDLRGAQRCADAFLRETGWRPATVLLVAGALAYSQYGFLKRWMMRRIARKAGGGTDTSRDYEYTDWARLRLDVEAFVRAAVPPPGLDGAVPERVASAVP